MEKTLVELIVNHLLREIERNGETAFKRHQLAEQFNCVPSQISYILETKFKTSNQFVVEIQRGSGGFIRIKPAIIWIDDHTKESPEEFIERAYRCGVISKREALLMLTGLQYMDDVSKIKAVNDFYKILRGNVK